MMHQTIYDTSQLCYLQGVRNAVFSPGSRNAPLSISFHRHKGIEKYVILDERSAGFIALGIAQQTKQPVVLCCTSGTALLNYGPAIAEAYYQHIPLIVLSADRPPEWIDQWDGQTIRQQQAFASLTKAFYQLPVDLTHPDSQWEYERKIREAITLAMEGKKGPVQVNIPFREPFYPNPNQKLEFSNHLRALTLHKSGYSLLENEKSALQEEWHSCQKKLIILGQGWPDTRTKSVLEKLIQTKKAVVVSDITGNGHDIDGCIRHQDLFLQRKAQWATWQPDLVITIGQSLISKNLKLMLRTGTFQHWHLEKHPVYADPLQSLRNCVTGEPSDILALLENSTSNDPGFQKSWTNANQLAASALRELDRLPYSEIMAFREVMAQIPENTDLHLSNSMPVRYANFIGLYKKNINVYANRGTSGIDGTNGTAVGHALAGHRRAVLLTGDLSFLYDRNAFFHEYDLSNLQIIVFNNFGGGIFNLIPGPAQLPEQERSIHFLTPHSRDMKVSAQEAGFGYTKANDEITLELALSSFFSGTGKPRLLEIQTNPEMNQKVFLEIKRIINEQESI
ncbi:MAG: 2-succinyl-5-enolpyruvyl-6-hydroxy-3-cyclohexene-1-carboxylic-acid synthase [Cyclobacteriaceae bacterium]|nr:2-succinyl-5-enolpyruvyl-6-hydroxy-3-cyclohexene-1-carboxylic-acid synthase [Cyclobacteriaceae bacterium]